MHLPTNRKIFFFIFITCTFSLAYAFYAEFYQGMEPCPLCIAQRVIIFVIALLSLIYALHNPRGVLSRIYGLIITVFAAAGIKIAAHHVWLINLPPEQQPLSCGMPLTMLYQRVPLQSFLHTILQGDAECGKITWKVMGILPPVAVIILCSIIAILGLLVTLRKKNKFTDR